MTPQLVGEGQGFSWKVSKALVPFLDLWLTVLYDTGYLLPLVSQLARYVLIADHYNLEVWRVQAKGTSVSPLDLCKSFVISAECNRLKDNSLQTSVSKPVRHVLIADSFNLKVWRDACPRYKCITPRLVQNLCHQYRM